MNKPVIAWVVLGVLAAGCGSRFWRGEGRWHHGEDRRYSADYELRTRQQMELLEADYRAGRISQHDHDARRDQILSFDLRITNVGN